MAEEETGNTFPHVCQYWIEDEPVQCSNWDEESQKCTYVPEPDVKSLPPYYPLCNRIGTETDCKNYDGTGSKARCILPDPSRHTLNRKTGEKWLKDDITKYEDGKCNEEGTEIKCSGYAPYHAAFGKLQPSGDEELTEAVGIDELGYRLPLIYEVYNVRARLSRCYWWKGESSVFDISQETGEIGGDSGEKWESKCICEDELTIKYQDFRWEEALGRDCAPCNGAKPECPCYTGVCWEYCLDEHMREGDKIMAEQILELRYYLKKDTWRPSVYRESFADPAILAWEGKIFTQIDEDGHIRTMIPAIEVYMDDFDEFNIERKSITLSAGTGSNIVPGTYPTLVREIKDLPLSPIIRSVFDRLPDGPPPPPPPPQKCKHFRKPSSCGYTNQPSDEEDFRPSEAESCCNAGMCPHCDRFEVDELDMPEEIPMYVFEAAKYQHKHILIVGEIFYYNSRAYGINLDDPDLEGILPPELKEYPNMYEMRASLSEESFAKIYTNLECVLEWLITFQPDKVCRSGASSGETSFYILMSTLFTDNEIAVFDKGSGSWEYDKINVKKFLCNGVIGQTSFSVEGSGGLISYLAGYENDFASYANKNGSVGFDFFPFISSEGGNAALSYIYNDAVRKKLPVNPALPPEFDTYDMGYELFKVKFCENIEIKLKPDGKDEFKIIGNAGLVLVIIADDGRRLSNVVKPWEIKNDKIVLTIRRDDLTVEVEMEIIEREEYIDKLEINQILIRPKDITKWTYPCNDATLFIDSIYYYEKRSFGETPEGEFEKIRDLFLTKDDIINYDTTLSLGENDEGGYNLAGFGYNHIMISVVFKGIMGRIRGQTKTKIVTWVRQPYCRDVEIYYTWYREYQKCTLLPEFDCFGSPGMRCESEHGSSVYVPLCGDHDLSPMTEKGPMWYPYEECDGSARYNITGNLTEWDINVMEPFLEGEHGYWDMRMFGPVDQDAYTCDTHSSLWACGCDWSFCNTYAVTGSFFQGWGRYRGGITGDEKFQCVALEGTLPKFGNVFRDFLRSFRSVDNIDYYYFTGRGYQRRRKWVPVPELYSISDLTAGPSGYPFLLYSSNDYYDDGGSFVYPLGLMLAKDAIEGIDIKESIELDGGTGSPKRYKFDEIFKVDYSLAGLNYPYRKDIAMRMSGGILKPIICWYVYKDYQGEGGPSESIQWAWREIWEELKRFSFESEDMKCGAQGDVVMIDLFCMVWEGGGQLPQNCIEIGAYKFECRTECRWECMGDIKGRHVFLEMDHPDYRYDAILGEHRLVCDEGTHEIWFYPPSLEEEGGVADTFLWFSIDEGSKRAFDPQTNEWDPPGAEKFDPEAYKLYTTCTKDPWVTNVTLFAEGYDDPSESVAEDDGRVIITYDDVGEEVKTYYQRGLEARVLTDNLNELPGLEEHPAGWEVLFHHKPDCIEDSDRMWDNVELYEWYEAIPCLEIEYCSGVIGDGEFVEILYTLPGPKVAEEGEGTTGPEKLGFPSRVVFDFLWGVGESDPGEEQAIPKLYHKPAIKIYATGYDTPLYELMFTVDEMVMSSKEDGFGVVRCTYSWSVPWELRMQKPPQKVKFKFRISPTAGEIAKTSGLAGYYDSYKHVIGIKCVYIYIAGIGEASEEIETYERLYNISSGQHGDFPPHGRDTTGSILNPLPVDKSTVYQNDSPGGVIGMPISAGKCDTMNKCRGRILYECHEDKEALPGGNLHGWEEEQKKVYDAIALDGETSFTFSSVCPPAFEKQLNDIGIIFPSWTCPFTNTLVLPLAPVIPRDTFSAPGHYFDWDFSNLERKLCGRLFARVYRDVFMYVYRRASTGEIMWDSMDAIAAYYMGVGALMTNPANYTATDADRAEQAAQTLMSTSTQRALYEAREKGTYESADSVN